MALERDGLVLSYNNIVKIGCGPQVQWTDVVDLELDHRVRGQEWAYGGDAARNERSEVDGSPRASVGCR